MTAIRLTRRSLLVFACVLAWQFALANEGASPSREAKPSDKTRRDELLDSESWRKTMGGLDEWFSVQTIYDRNQVRQIERQLARRAEEMSADELEAFQQDLDAKLRLVLGPEGRDILGWVRANLAAAAPAYRKKLDLHYPDVVKLTAAQLRNELDRLKGRRSAAQNQTAALEQSRQARIAALQTQQQQQNNDRERTLDRGAASFGPGGYHSPYHPGGAVRQYPDVVARPAYGFGYGFGFW